MGNNKNSSFHDDITKYEGKKGENISNQSSSHKHNRDQVRSQVRSDAFVSTLVFFSWHDNSPLEK